MAANPEAAPDTARDLVITRVFKAPRELVFKAWTEPGHLAHWSGPEGFTTPHSSMDMRPGGRWRACLRAPDGTDHWVGGTYMEIQAPVRLVMTHAWEDAQGQVGHETVVTVTLAEHGDGQTFMTFRQARFESVAERDGHEGGWSSSFDKLATHLAAQGA